MHTANHGTKHREHKERVRERHLAFEMAYNFLMDL